MSYRYHETYNMLRLKRLPAIDLVLWLNGCTDSLKKKQQQQHTHTRKKKTKQNKTKTKQKKNLLSISDWKTCLKCYGIRKRDTSMFIFDI